MEPSTDTETKLGIGYALSDRLAPIATIVKNITTSTKIIDDLPSAAIEAMLDYSKESPDNTARIGPERLLSVHTRMQSRH
jgi:hypothetical protein